MHDRAVQVGARGQGLRLHDGERPPHTQHRIGVNDCRAREHTRRDPRQQKSSARAIKIRCGDTDGCRIRHAAQHRDRIVVIEMMEEQRTGHDICTDWQWIAQHIDAFRRDGHLRATCGTARNIECNTAAVTQHPVDRQAERAGAASHRKRAIPRSRRDIHDSKALAVRGAFVRRRHNLRPQEPPTSAPGVQPLQAAQRRLMRIDREMWIVHPLIPSTALG